jgi:hypothetical protein
MSDTATKTASEIELLDDDDATTDRGALAERLPVPATITHLAARGAEGLDIFKTLVTILETARTNVIRLSNPEDWNLYQTRDGRITGYLSDAGCHRGRDVIGLEVYHVGTPERIAAADGQSFMYVITGDGRSRLTGQRVERIEGGRSSTEDFCKDDTGAELELKVRKAARANLNGNIARELFGLKNVPIAELIAAWEGTKKDWNRCNKAQGFGSTSERLGAAREGVPDVPPPTCPVCKGDDGQPLPLVYRAAKGNNKPFYGCRNWDKHRQVKAIVDAADWIAQEHKRAASIAADARARAAEVEANNRLDEEIAKAEGHGNGR